MNVQKPISASIIANSMIYKLKIKIKLNQKWIGVVLNLVTLISSASSERIVKESTQVLTSLKFSKFSSFTRNPRPVNDPNFALNPLKTKWNQKQAFWSCYSRDIFTFLPQIFRLGVFVLSPPRWVPFFPLPPPFSIFLLEIAPLAYLSTYNALKIGARFARFLVASTVLW